MTDSGAFASVRFVIGSRWKDDTNALLRHAPDATMDRLDIRELLAPIDIVVGTENLTSSLPDERVVPFIAQLAKGLAELQSGQSSKVIVGLEESPWEVTLDRISPSQLELWLYEVRPPWRSICDGKTVELDSLAESVRATLSRLLSATRELPPGRASQALLDTFLEARRRLEEPSVGAMPAQERARESHQPHLVVASRSEGGVELVSTLDVQGHALLRYDGEHALDRHALTPSGFIAFRTPTGSGGFRIPCRPLLTLDEVVDGIAELLSAWPETEGEWPLLRTHEAEISLVVRERTATLTCRRGEEVVWSGRFPLPDLLALLLDHAHDVFRRCCDANPLLQANEFVTEVMERAARARRTVILAIAGDRPAEREERVRATVPRMRTQTLERPRDLVHEAENLLRLRPERIWSLSRERFDTRSFVRTADDGWLLRTERGVERLDAASGSILWRRPLAGDLTAGFAAAGDHLLVESSPGTWALVATQDGREVATIEAPEACDAPTGLLPLFKEDGGVLIGWGASRGLFALDSSNGEFHWSRSAGLSGVVDVVFAEGVLVAALRDGAVIGLHPMSGELLWRCAVPMERIQLRARGRNVLVLADSVQSCRAIVGIVDAVSGRWERRETRRAWVADATREPASSVPILLATARHHELLVADLDTGTLRARTRFAFDGALHGSIRCRGTEEGVMIMGPGGLCFLGADPDRSQPQWATRLGGWRARARHQAPVDATAGLTVVAGDEICLLSLQTGRVLHREHNPYEEIVWVDLDADGNFLALERSESGAETLHGFRAVGHLALVVG